MSLNGYIQRERPKYTQTGVILGAVAGAVTITHNLNTEAVEVETYFTGTKQTTFLSATRLNANQISLQAGGGPVSIDVVILG